MNRNRAERRKMKGQADAVAKIFAANVRATSGQGKPVTDPLAIKCLTRAFAHMLRQQGKPHVIKLTSDQARAFGVDRQLSEGQTYLAVGLDQDGRGTYATQEIATPGADPMTAELCNRRTALERLAPHLKATNTRAHARDARP